MGTFAVYSGSERIVAKALSKAGIEAQVGGRVGDGVEIRVADGKHAAAMAVVERIQTNNSQSFPVMWTMAGIVLVLGVAAIVAPAALAVAGPYIMIVVIVLGGLRMLVYNGEWAHSFTLGGVPMLAKAAWVLGIVTLLGFVLFAAAVARVWGVV